MKFTVERDKFHDALSVAVRPTKGGPDIPILSHVLVVAAENAVTLTGRDLDSCSIVSVAAEVTITGEIAIPADRLHKLTAGLSKGAMLTIEAGEHSATVRCGRSAYKFSTLPATDFPDLLELQGDPPGVDLTAEQIGRLLDVPAVCISTEETRFYLKGICVHPIRGGIVACATNGHILIKTTIKADRADFPRVIIPERATREIVSIAKSAGAKLRITKALISAEYGDRLYISKLIDGTFPDYDRVIPQARDNPLKVDAKDLDGSLSRLVVARDPKQAGTVKLAWSGKEFAASLHSDFGQGEERLEADSECDPCEVGAQLDYLRALVEASGGEVVVLDIGGAGDPIRITNPQRDDFVAVCMPCRF